MKKRLGLDGERSWIVISEANDFPWPGPDIRLVPKKSSIAYGALPPNYFNELKRRVLKLIEQRRFLRTRRTK